MSGVGISRRWFCWVLAVCCCVVSGGVSAEEKWESLFDGKTLQGWKKAEHGRAIYEVVDGAIHGVTVEGSPNSFLNLGVRGSNPFGRAILFRYLA